MFGACAGTSSFSDARFPDILNRQGVMIGIAQQFLSATSYLLVALAVWDVLRGWLRDRDRFQADLLIVMGLLVGILLAGPSAGHAAAQAWPVGLAVNALFLSQPYFLFRLARRFQRVPTVWW